MERPLNRGAELYLQGCYPRALEYFQEAHERYTALDDLAGIANSLNSIANVYYQMNDAPSAIRVYAEALFAYRQVDDVSGMVRVLCNQAAALIRGGQLDEAAHRLDQADALADGDSGLRILRLKNRALLAMAQNDRDLAEALLTEALAGGAAENDPAAAAAHYSLGRLLIDAGHPQQAEVHLQAALDSDRAAGAFPAVGKDLVALGDCYTRLGNHAAAASCYQRGAKIFALLQDTDRVQEALVALNESAARSGTDMDASLHWIDQWLEGRTEANLCR